MFQSSFVSISIDSIIVLQTNGKVLLLRNDLFFMNSEGEVKAKLPFSLKIFSEF